MKREVKKSNLSQGWQVVVCDHQCYTSQVNSKNFKLKPNEIIHDFKVAFRPNGKEGSGKKCLVKMFLKRIYGNNLKTFEVNIRKTFLI